MQNNVKRTIMCECVRVFVHVWVCACVCVCGWMWVCMCGCVRVCVCARVCACVCSPTCMSIMMWSTCKDALWNIVPVQAPLTHELWRHHSSCTNNHLRKEHPWHSALICLLSSIQSILYIIAAYAWQPADIVRYKSMMHFIDACSSCGTWLT